MPTATNVTNGKPNKAGAIFYAPLGTTLPTNASDSIDTTVFKALGFVSEDGLSNDNSPESEKVKAWGGYNVLNLQTDRPDEFTFTLLEVLNEDVLKAVYGENNVSVSTDTATLGDITVHATADDMPSGAWVVDMVLRGNRKKRIVIPNASISSLGTISYKDNEATGYALTLAAVPDATGAYHHEYIKA